jgi:hypothetical protein
MALHLGLAEGFKPNLIGGIVLWLKADVGITQSGGTVSAWADQSPLANNFSQATGSMQPTYVSNANNNLPGLSFDGVDDFMTAASTITGDAISMFMAYSAIGTNNAAGNANAIMVQLADPAWLAHLTVLSGAANNWGCYATTGALSGQTLANTPTILSSVARAPNDIDFVQDGTLANLTNGSNYTFARSTTAIGGSGTAGQYTTITLQEVIVYNFALSVNQRKAVEQYLSKRYNVVVTP